MARETVLTPEGYEKLKTEIEHLRTTKRREVAERIKEAREFGDISENAEYDHAKNEQAMLEARIAQLEDKLRNATVIDQKQLEAGRRLGRHQGARQGPEVRPVDGVPDRRLGRGGPVREQALERVARRQRADRPQARRRRHASQVPRGPSRKLKITKIEAA